MQMCASKIMSALIVSPEVFLRKMKNEDFPRRLIFKGVIKFTSKIVILRFWIFSTERFIICWNVLSWIIFGKKLKMKIFTRRLLFRGVIKFPAKIVICDFGFLVQNDWKNVETYSPELFLRKMKIFPRRPLFRDLENFRQKL